MIGRWRRRSLPGVQSIATSVVERLISRVHAFFHSVHSRKCDVCRQRRPGDVVLDDGDEVVSREMLGVVFVNDDPVRVAPMAARKLYHNVITLIWTDLRVHVCCPSSDAWRERARLFGRPGGRQEPLWWACGAVWCAESERTL